MAASRHRLEVYRAQRRAAERDQAYVPAPHSQDPPFNQDQHYPTQSKPTSTDPTGSTPMKEHDMSNLQQPPPDTGQQLWPSEQPRQNPGWASNPYAAPAYPGTASGPVPLWAPLYGASLPEAVSRFFKKYATFSGRASRSEYWWWALVSGIVSIVLNVITAVISSAGATLRPDGTSVPGPGYMVVLILAVIISLAIFVPSLAVSVRRLHDTNMSGWMYLLILIPFVGPILIVVFMALGSKPEGQRFDVPA